MIMKEIEDREPLERLSKDLREAAKLMTREEVRYLVDTYYQWQLNRMRSASQVRALVEQKEPSALLPWLEKQSRRVEREIKKALAAWAEEQPVGRWLGSICGIGPALTAGLMAYIDITKASTAGKIWSFAGLNPTVKWEKGQKRPWCAQLKTLAWKAGQSFVKVSSNENDIYGKIWRERKELEQRKNEAGDYKDIARERAKTVGKKTEAYKYYAAGKLPPGHIHARAKRYAVKMFLSHLHEVMYLDHYKTPPPKPWVIEHGGHVDYIPPPNLAYLR